MKKLIILIPLFLLISYNQLIVLNQLMIRVSDGMSETLITLPNNITGEDVKQVYETPSGTYAYKLIVKDKERKIYTNDSKFLQTFNKLSKNQKKIFMKTYSVYDTIPDTMSGKFYVKNATEQYINNLQDRFNNQLEISNNQHSGKLYYIRYGLTLLILNLIMFSFCLIYYLNEFEKNKRKLLLHELNGNRSILGNQIKRLNLQIITVYILCFLFIVRVDTVIELISFALLLLLMFFNVLVLSGVIHFVYKRKINRNFRKSLHVMNPIYSFLFMIIWIIFIMLSINSVVGLSKYGLEYYNNYAVMKSKPEEFKTMYRAGSAWTSELNSGRPNDLSEYPGYYLSYGNMSDVVKVNCKYATEYLNFHTCELGTYTYSAGHDSESTYGKEIIVDPFDLTMSKVINPKIEIIDNSRVLTSDMYWEKDPGIPYLDIQQNNSFYKLEQNYLKDPILTFGSRIIIQVMMLISTISIFITTYKANYGRKLAIKQMNGRKVSIGYMYWIVAFATFGITSTIINLLPRMEYFRFEFILSIVIVALSLFLVNKKIIKNIIKCIK